MLGLVLVLAFATTIKPAASIFFWIVIAVALIFGRQTWRTLIEPVLAYVLIMLVWSMLYWAYSPARVAPMYPNAPRQGLLAWLAQNPQTPFLGPPNAYVGYHFLSKFYRFREYLSSGQRGARDWFVAPPPWPNLLAGEPIVAEFDVEPSATCAAEFPSRAAFLAWLRDPAWHSAHCSGEGLGQIFNRLQYRYGEERAGRMMMQAALHIAITQPIARWILLGDWLQALVISSGETLPPRDFTGWRDATEAQLVGSIKGGAVNNLPNAMKPAIGQVGQRSDLQRTISAVLELQYETYRAAKPLLFALMLLAFIPLLRRPGSGLTFATFLLLAYIASATIWVVAMIMPGSDPRHEDVYSFFPLFVIMLGARAMVKP